MRALGIQEGQKGQKCNSCPQAALGCISDSTVKDIMKQFQLFLEGEEVDEDDQQ